MTVLAQKTKKTALIKLQLILGAVLMAAVCIFIPVYIFSLDTALLTNTFVWGLVAACWLLFGVGGYFSFVRPYFLFRRLPDVQAETDGTYLYLHTTKEAKIPLAEMENTFVQSDVSYYLNQDLLVHFLSDRYGMVRIEVPGYGKFKLRFISQVQDVPQRIVSLIETKI